MFNKLVIIGVGLIGGSVALAARRGDLARQITGVGRKHETLAEALDLGVIDHAAGIEEAVRDADLVLLAMPVGAMPAVMAAIAPHLPPHAIVTDAGSTKGDVVAAARAHLGDCLPQFIPAHPIAGAEKSGVSAARVGLFDGKNVVLTPLAENSTEHIARTEAFWRGCGAQVSLMTPEAHDRIFAAISHLPHVLAFALVDDLARRDNAAEILGFAAGGFRDFSRIASSSPEMWRDICIANRPALLDEIDAYQRELTLIRSLVDQADGAALQALFNNAQSARNQWIKHQEKA